MPGAKYERSPLVQGASLVSETPHIGKAPGVGTGDGGGVVIGPDGKSYPWTIGFFFGNTELSLELWTVISGISGFDDY